MGTIINNIIIREAIEEAAASKVVRVTESRSVRKFDRVAPGVRAAEQQTDLAFWDALFSAEEARAARNEPEMVLVSFLDEDEDFTDAETGESLYSGFSVRL